jgi:predicted dehydrogenase
LDIVNARRRFENGCVANTTASRVSLKTERKLRLFQDDAYMSIDLQQKILTIVRKEEEQADGALPQVRIDERSFDQTDALKMEIESFLECARTGQTPVVTGEDGLRALQTAIRITDQIVKTATVRAI